MKTFMHSHLQYFNNFLISLLQKNFDNDYPHLLLYSRSSFVTNFVVETLFKTPNETHGKETLFNNTIRYTSYKTFIDIDMALIDLANAKDLICLFKELCCHKPLKARRIIVVRMNATNKKIYNCIKTFMEKFSNNSWFIVISKTAIPNTLPITYVNCNICNFSSFIKDFCNENNLPVIENLINISDNDPLNYCILITLKNPKSFTPQIEIYITNELNKLGRLLSKPVDLCLYLDTIKDLAYSISSSGVPLQVFGKFIIDFGNLFIHFIK